MDDRSVRPDGDTIRRRRQGRFWSQEKLADEAGLRKRTIERAEAGKRLQRRTLHAIAQALGVQPEALVRSDSASEPPHDRMPATAAPKPDGVPLVHARGIGPDQAIYEAARADLKDAETNQLPVPSR
jgi:transcriptional regulator with XRE-family HTH domain